MARGGVRLPGGAAPTLTEEVPGGVIKVDSMHYNINE